MKARLSSLSFLMGLVTVFAVGTTWAQDADPLNGTWKLNLAKSTFNPGPAPQSQTVMIEGTDTVRKIMVDVTPATGSALHWEVSGAAGAQLPVVGNNPNADTYVLTRVDATTLEAQYMKDGKATLKQTAVVSADGKTLTVTGSGTDAQGRAINNIAVYEK